MRGKRVKWKTIYEDKSEYNFVIPQVQIAEREDKTLTLQLYMPIIGINRKHNAVSYEPSWEGIRAIIEGMIEIYGKFEVERELNIKIEEKT